MTPEQRTAERDAARERVISGRQAVRQAGVQAALSEADGWTDDPDMAVYLSEARVRQSQWFHPVGTESDRQAMVHANQELGRDVFRATECEVQNRMEDARVDDASIPDEFARRVAAHPDRATERHLEDRLHSDPEWERRLNAQADRERSDQGEQPVDGQVTDEEYRRRMVDLFGESELNEAQVRDRLAVHRYRANLYDGAPPSRELPPWPVNAQEREALFSNLRRNISHRSARADVDVTNDLNRERGDIYYAALHDELGRVQRFGGETARIKGTNSSFLKRDQARFDKAVTLFPDEMVAAATEHYPDLVVRKSKRRAYFSQNKSTEYQEKATKYIHPTRDPNTGRFTEARFFYGEDSGSMSSWASTDTPENRERLNKIVAEHNSGDNPFPASSQRRRASRPPQMVVAEVTDEAGQTRIAIRAKSPTTTTVHTISPEIAIGEDQGSLVHELGHYMESDPQVHQVCKQFLHDRTAGLDKEVYHRSRAHGTEYAVGDGFFTSYVGKDYVGQQNTEVFSMGMEAVFTNSHGSTRFGKPSRVQDGDVIPSGARDDPEHRDLILGIIAGFDRQGRKPMNKTEAAAFLMSVGPDRRDA